LHARHGLPVVDPIAIGMHPIADFLLENVA